MLLPLHQSSYRSYPIQEITPLSPSLVWICVISFKSSCTFMLRVLQIPICHTRKKARLRRRNGTGITGAVRGDPRRTTLCPVPTHWYWHSLKRAHHGCRTLSALTARLHPSRHGFFRQRPVALSKRPGISACQWHKYSKRLSVIFQLNDGMGIYLS
jgi:hypothetical protein